MALEATNKKGALGKP